LRSCRKHHPSTAKKQAEKQPRRPPPEPNVPLFEDHGRLLACRSQS
jgi:hypothetical protein